MRILFFFALIFIYSCSSRQEIPVDILSQEKMGVIMWDMFRADEFVSNFGRRDSSHTVKDKSTYFYEEIFRIHKTNKSQFEKSITFYNLHPDLFKTVVDSLEKRRTNLSNEFYKPASVDSLKIKARHIPLQKK